MQTERVLFHYNGHGVPKPTANGEIWVFNKVRGGEVYIINCLVPGHLWCGQLDRGLGTSWLVLINVHGYDSFRLYNSLTT